MDNSQIIRMDDHPYIKKWFRGFEYRLSIEMEGTLWFISLDGIEKKEVHRKNIRQYGLAQRQDQELMFLIELGSKSPNGEGKITFRPLVEMSSFDRWFRCKISKRQKEQIEREERESGGRRRPQQIIQLAAAAGGTLPRTVVNTPTGASLAIQRGPLEGCKPAPAKPPRLSTKMGKNKGKYDASQQQPALEGNSIRRPTGRPPVPPQQQKRPGASASSDSRGLFKGLFRKKSTDSKVAQPAAKASSSPQPPPDPDANVYDELYDDYDDPDEYIADMYDELNDESHREGDELCGGGEPGSERRDPPEEEVGRNIGATAAAAAASAAARSYNRSDSSTGSTGSGPKSPAKWHDKPSTHTEYIYAEEISIDQYPEDKNAVMVNEDLYAVPEQKEGEGRAPHDDQSPS